MGGLRRSSCSVEDTIEQLTVVQRACTGMWNAAAPIIVVVLQSDRKKVTKDMSRWVLSVAIHNQNEELTITNCHEC